MHQFIHTLLSAQSPRTIIQTTVNTIESDKVTQPVVKTMIGQFYLALDKIFNFQLGKILLAVTSSSQVKNMMENDSPYISQYREEIEQCLHGDSCQRVTDFIRDLGKYL